MLSLAVMVENREMGGQTVDNDIWWISTHSAEVAQHAGEWIAVRDGIVASGKILKEVIESAEKQGIADPLLHRVHEHGVDHFVF